MVGGGHVAQLVTPADVAAVIPRPRERSAWIA